MTIFKNMFKEGRRAAALQALGVLNTPAEPGFDRFVDAAATAFDAPISLMSLIHGNTQWFKAARGMVIDCIPRDSGFCSFTLDQPGVLESCAPEADPRFARLPVVTGAPHIRYYIGAPLQRLSGIDVGVLCVLDVQARKPASRDQKAYLIGLARQASLALEARLDAWGNAA